MVSDPPQQAPTLMMALLGCFSRMFSGLRSQWITRCLRKYARHTSICAVADRNATHSSHQSHSQPNERQRTQTGSTRADRPTSAARPLTHSSGPRLSGTRACGAGWRVYF